MRTLLFVIVFSLFLISNAYAIPQVQVVSNSTPQKIAPGEQFIVQLTIANIGSEKADKIVVSLLSLDSPLTSKSSSIINLGSLEAGKSVSTVFVFVSSKDTADGFYSIMFNIDSCQSACLTFSHVAVVEVKSPATNFEISFQSYSDGIVSLSVANIGINPAIAVSVNVPKQISIELNGASTVFLGNLDSGDSTIADFNLTAKNDTSSLKIEVSYTDSNGERHTIEKTVSANIISGGFLRKTAQTDNSETNLIIIAAIVVVIVFSVYRYRKGKKK